jgi:hypothetical protein
MSFMPDRAADGSFVLSIAGLNEPHGLRARLVGSHNATITAGQTVNLDWQIPQLAWLGVNKQAYFDGVQYYAKSAEVGDNLKYQVVDIDGIVYPAGTVLEEFGSAYYVMPDSHVTTLLYKAKLIAGMYIRIVYTSVGATNVKFVCNLFRHLNENETV